MNYCNRKERRRVKGEKEASQGGKDQAKENTMEVQSFK